MKWLYALLLCFAIASCGESCPAYDEIFGDSVTECFDNCDPISGAIIAEKTNPRAPPLTTDTPCASSSNGDQPHYRKACDALRSCIAFFSDE